MPTKSSDEKERRGQWHIKNTSTVINKKIVPITKRQKSILVKIEELSKAKLVVTDRLHTMVFSLLAGTPCIAFDNSTHKVVGVSNTWLQSMSGLRVIDMVIESGLEDELDKILIDSFLEECPTEIDFRYFFSELEKDIERLTIKSQD